MNVPVVLASSELSQQSLQQFLTFMLRGQEFGIEILRVQEIKNYSQVTPIPNSPANVLGVINLRGTVIPIVDLRSTFGMGQAEYDQFTVIIVVNIDSKIMGLLVDAVSDVLDVSVADIEVPPALAAAEGNCVIQGIAKSEDRLISLIDIGAMMATDFSFGGAAC